MILSPNDRTHGFLREIRDNSHAITLTLEEFAGSWLRMSDAAHEILNNWRTAELCQHGIMRCEQDPMDSQSRMVLRNSLTQHGSRALNALDDGFVWLSDPGRICLTSTNNMWQCILNAPGISDANFQRALNIRSPKLKDIRNAFVQRKLRSVRGANNMWVIAND